jgi:hypothetical protein
MLSPLKGRVYTADDRGVDFQKGVKVSDGVYLYPEAALEAFRRRGMDTDPLTVLTKTPHLYPNFYSMFSLETQGIEPEEVVTTVTEAWIRLTNGFRSEDLSKLPLIYWDIDGAFTHPTAIGRKRGFSQIRPDLNPVEEGFDIWGE